MERIEYVKRKLNGHENLLSLIRRYMFSHFSISGRGTLEFEDAIHSFPLKDVYQVRPSPLEEKSKLIITIFYGNE